LGAEDNLAYSKKIINFIPTRTRILSMNRLFFDIREQLLQYYDGFVVLIPRLGAVIVILVITWIVARLIRNFSDRRLKKQMQDPLLAEFMAMMIRTVIIILGLLFSFNILGLGGVTASILAGAGITAFIIGFALRDIGENFLAGIILAFKRPFRVGDFIETSGIRGKVVALNIRVTQLKTTDGKDVFIPNAIIMKTPLFNNTIDRFLRFEFPVSLPQGLQYHRSIRTIEMVLEKVPGIQKRSRRPRANVSGIAPGKIDLTVSYWIDIFKEAENIERIKTQALLAVQQALEQASKQN
jgi:small conductance mechanosensitive channel